MRFNPTRLYTWVASVGLFLQGASTLTALLVPAVDRAVPGLLQQTQMIPAHSVLHILSGLLGFAAFRAGSFGTRSFAFGFGLFYVGLGIAGGAGPHELGLGLKPFDHPFHLVLGGFGLIAAAVELIWARLATRSGE
jgi:hypothetical protein